MSYSYYSTCQNKQNNVYKCDPKCKNNNNNEKLKQQHRQQLISDQNKRISNLIAELKKTMSVGESKESEYSLNSDIINKKLLNRTMPVVAELNKSYTVIENSCSICLDQFTNPYITP